MGGSRGRGADGLPPGPSLGLWVTGWMGTHSPSALGAWGVGVSNTSRPAAPSAAPPPHLLPRTLPHPDLAGNARPGAPVTRSGWASPGAACWEPDSADSSSAPEPIGAARAGCSDLGRTPTSLVTSGGTRLLSPISPACPLVPSPYLRPTPIPACTPALAPAASPNPPVSWAHVPGAGAGLDHGDAVLYAAAAWRAASWPHTLQGRQI